MILAPLVTARELEMQRGAAREVGVSRAAYQIEGVTPTVAPRPAPPVAAERHMSTPAASSAAALARSTPNRPGRAIAYGRTRHMRRVGRGKRIDLRFASPGPHRRRLGNPIAYVRTRSTRRLRAIRVQRSLPASVSPSDNVTLAVLVTRRRKRLGCSGQRDMSTGTGAVAACIW